MYISMFGKAKALHMYKQCINYTLYKIQKENKKGRSEESIGDGEWGEDSKNKTITAKE